MVGTRSRSRPDRSRNVIERSRATIGRRPRACYLTLRERASDPIPRAPARLARRLGDALGRAPAREERPHPDERPLPPLPRRLSSDPLPDHPRDLAPRRRHGRISAPAPPGSRLPRSGPRGGSSVGRGRRRRQWRRRCGRGQGPARRSARRAGDRARSTGEAATAWTGVAGVHDCGRARAAGPDSGGADAGVRAREERGGEEVGAPVSRVSGGADGADSDDTVAMSEVCRGGGEWEVEDRVGGGGDRCVSAAGAIPVSPLARLPIELGGCALPPSFKPRFKLPRPS